MFLLSVVMIFSVFTGTVMAKDNFGSNDQYLLKIGFSPERIKAMPEELKLSIINDGAIALVSSEPWIPSSTSEIIRPMGTIDDSSITGLVERVQLTSSGGKKRYKIIFNWVWNDDTFYNMTDKVGISYDSGFQTDPDTNGGYDCKHYTIFKPTGQYEYEDNCGGSPGNIDYGGATWNVDVLAGAVDAGYSSMNIIAKSATSGTTQGTILTKYVHDTSLVFGIGVTIGPLLLTFSSAGTFDEKPWQTTFYY